MVVISLILGLALVVIFAVYYKAKKKRSEYTLPPGPSRKPLVGNLFDIDTTDVHISLSELGRGYTDLFSLKIGNANVIVLQTIEAFREFYGASDIAESVSGRENNFVANYITEKKDIVTAAYTPAFHTRRSTLRSSARKFEEVQGKWGEELSQFVDQVGSNVKKPQDLEQPITVYLTNLMLITLIGQRFDHDDPRLLMIVERNSLVKSFLIPGANGVLTIFPWLRHLSTGYGKQFKRLELLSQKLKETIFDSEKASFNPNAARGGLDELLKLQHDSEDQQKSELSDDHIWRSVLSVIGSGAGAGIGQLLYFFIAIVRQPNICVRIQREVDSVIGKKRLPRIEDKERMQYTEAVILELLRWVSPTPVLLPRCTSTDIKFKEYSIPKNTTIITNAWEIHHNKTFWKDPWKFRPERFLDQTGCLLSPESDERQRLIPFGTANRKCIGGDLTNTATFLVITSLLQRFDFDAPSKGLPPPDPHYHRDSTPTLTPMPFSIIVKPRPV